MTTAVSSELQPYFDWIEAYEIRHGLKEEPWPNQYWEDLVEKEELIRG